MKMSVSLTQSQRSEEFPITKTKVFLAHAALSPFPRRVCAAIQDYCQSNAVQGQWEYLYGDKEKQARQYAASLLGGEEDEIAFVSSTSMGLSIIAGGLPWRNGDNLIIADGDFPANVYPWLHLARLGVETRFIRRRPDGAICAADVLDLADDRTRLVSLSSVNYITGFRTDLNSIGEMLYRKGILFCVDAVQSLGVLPFDSQYVDFAAASSHKWLLGPMGIGVLFVKRKNFDILEPPLIGWKSVKSNKRYLDYKLEFVDSARRYEPGSPNGIGLMGLHAALGILTEAGTENVGRRIARFRELLVNRITELGYKVISPGDWTGSSIVSFTGSEAEIVALREYLDKSGIIVSIRDTLDGRRCIRVAPHFYNTVEDIQALLDGIRAFQQRKALAHAG